MAKKVLVIVDAQNDFIDGTLGVGFDKWEAAYKNIEKLFQKKWDSIVMTLDWHPVNHISFKDRGGMWPSHCVAATHGAQLYWKLEELIGCAVNAGVDVQYIKKGQLSEIEEYGVNVATFLGAEAGTSDLYFTGLCFDYCVSECACMTASSVASATVVTDATAAISNDLTDTVAKLDDHKVKVAYTSDIILL